MNPRLSPPVARSHHIPARHLELQVQKLLHFRASLHGYPPLAALRSTLCVIFPVHLLSLQTSQSTKFYKYSIQAPQGFLNVFCLYPVRTGTNGKLLHHTRFPAGNGLAHEDQIRRYRQRNQQRVHSVPRMAFPFNIPGRI